MRTELQGYNSSSETFQVYKVYAFVIAITYFVLIFDWLSNLSNEWSMVYKSKTGTGSGRILSLKPVFLASRYVTLAWCTFVVATWASASSHHNVCEWFKYYPYGYSVVFLPAHLLMILRIHSIYGRPTKLLYILLGLAVACFAVEMAVNHLATSVLLVNTDPNFAICFTYPTTAVFSLVFIAPTIFHHILLVLTLWKSVRQLRSSKSVGITPILHVIQRDHILYTLAICLVNFANLVLVLQPHAWPYKLINQLPALVFTQIFLSRIVFSLKATQQRVAGGASTLNTSGLTNSNAHQGSGSGPSAASSGQQKSGRTGDTASTAVDSNQASQNEKNDKFGFTTPPQSTRKGSYPYAHTPKSSEEYASSVPTYRSHRRGSSAAASQPPQGSGEYRFPATQQRADADEIPALPSTQVPPFASMPLRYQGYRAPHRNGVNSSLRRPSRDTDQVQVTQETDVQQSSDVGHPRTYLAHFNGVSPPGTADSAVPPNTGKSSLPPGTAKSDDVANRSSGEVETAFMRFTGVPESAIPVANQERPAASVPSSGEQSYHTSGEGGQLDDVPARAH